MKLVSPAFEDGDDIPSRYSRDGEDVNPPLCISDVPERTGTLALIVDDLDSPIGRFTHWVLWNIPPDTRVIHEGAIPAGARAGLNGFGETGWSGPCPPSGRHRYRFRLMAVDGEVDLGMPQRRDRVERALSGRVLAEATLVGVFRAEQ